MLDFGTITNPKTNESKTLKVDWIDADPKDTFMYCAGAFLIGIGIELVYTGAFKAGASAYNNAQDKIFKELGLWVEK